MAESSKDVRAGGAFYELWGKDGLSGVLDKAQKRAAAFGSFLQKVGTKFGLAGAALGAPLAALFRGGMNRAADTARMATQLNVPIELMSKLQYAADAAGVSVQEVMDDTTGRYRGLVDRAPGLDADAARKAAEAQLQLKDATLALENALLPLLDVVTPYVKQFTEFVKQNAGGARLVAGIAVRLIAVGIAFKVAAAGVAVLITAFGVLKAVALAAYAVLASPLVIGGALGLGIFAGLVSLFGDLKGFLSFLGDGFRGLADVAKEAWGGISDALLKGDIEAAWNIVVAGMGLAWAEFVHTLTYAWIGFKLTFAEIATSIRLVWNDLTTGIAKGIATVAQQSLSLVSKLGRKGLLGIAGGRIADKADEILAELPSGAALDGINEEERNRLLDDLRQEKEKLVKDLLTADAERDKAREDLNTAVAAGKAPDMIPYFTSAAGAIGAGVLSRGQQQAIDVKGGFSGAALGQQFGIGDQVQKQTELLKQIAAGNGGLPGAIGDAVGKAVGVPVVR